jgi:hypothetical protein
MNNNRCERAYWGFNPGALSIGCVSGGTCVRVWVGSQPTQRISTDTSEHTGFITPEFSPSVVFLGVPACPLPPPLSVFLPLCIPVFLSLSFPPGILSVLRSCCLFGSLSLCLPVFLSPVPRFVYFPVFPLPAFLSSWLSTVYLSALCLPDFLPSLLFPLPPSELPHFLSFPRSLVLPSSRSLCLPLPYPCSPLLSLLELPQNQLPSNVSMITYTDHHIRAPLTS